MLENFLDEINYTIYEDKDDKNYNYKTVKAKLHFSYLCFESIFKTERKLITFKNNILNEFRHNYNFDLIEAIKNNKHEDLYSYTRKQAVFEIQKSINDFCKKISELPSNADEAIIRKFIPKNIRSSVICYENFTLDKMKLYIPQKNNSSIESSLSYDSWKSIKKNLDNPNQKFVQMKITKNGNWYYAYFIFRVYKSTPVPTEDFIAYKNELKKINDLRTYSGKDIKNKIRNINQIINKKYKEMDTSVFQADTSIHGRGNTMVKRIIDLSDAQIRQDASYLESITTVETKKNATTYWCRKQQGENSCESRNSFNNGINSNQSGVQLGHLKKKRMPINKQQYRKIWKSIPVPVRTFTSFRDNGDKVITFNRKNGSVPANYYTKDKYVDWDYESLSINKYRFKKPVIF